jgi:hypothetical protein
MKSNIIPISDDQHFADYAEFNPLADRPIETQAHFSLNWGFLGVLAFGATCWVAAMWGFFWLILNGPAMVNRLLLLWDKVWK